MKQRHTLGPYDLKNVLRRHSWSPAASRSTQMTALRLKQAIDPNINDRFNHRNDDPELVALLACGPGLVSLESTQLRDAALALGPERPIAATEFLEVAWRSGRMPEAVAVIDALLAATPNQPAFSMQRLFFGMLAGVVRMDAAAVVGDDRWSEHAITATDAADGLSQDRDLSAIGGVIDSVQAAVGLRRAVLDPAPVNSSSPSEGLRSRADALHAAGEALGKASGQATATGAYLRSVAAFCEVVAHLYQAEAAAFDADAEQVTAHRTAIERRCELIASEVVQALGDNDLLAAPMLEMIRAVDTHVAGSSVAPLLEMWRAMPLPVPVVVGRCRSAFVGTPTEPASSSSRPDGPPVAVVLASLDGHLITGPAVLRDGRVYELSVRVQAGEWPEWATRLDGELLSHLTLREVTTPTFTWSRADHADDPETYEQAGSVALNYQVAAGTPAPPLLMRLTWRGEVDGEPRTQSLDVAGHRELRLRPYDHSRDRATDFPVFDERLLAMYDRLAREGFDQDQLEAFCRLFTSICRVGLAITWEKKYRRGTRVTEREFHDDIHDRLMADAELGGRVDRGSPLALGFLDVRHDGITAELKVERQTPVTEERAPKYMGSRPSTRQPTEHGCRFSRFST